MIKRVIILFLLFVFSSYSIKAEEAAQSIADEEVKNFISELNNVMNTADPTKIKNFINQHYANDLIITTDVSSSSPDGQKVSLQMKFTKDQYSATIDSIPNGANGTYEYNIKLNGADFSSDRKHANISTEDRTKIKIPIDNNNYVTANSVQNCIWQISKTSNNIVAKIINCNQITTTN